MSIINGSVFITQQKIGNVHGFNPFIVSISKGICAKNIFGVIIPDIKKTAVFPLFCFRRSDLPGHLDI